MSRVRISIDFDYIVTPEVYHAIDEGDNGDDTQEDLKQELLKKLGASNLDIVELELISIKDSS